MVVENIIQAEECGTNNITWIILTSEAGICNTPTSSKVRSFNIRAQLVLGYQLFRAQMKKLVV